MFFSTGVDAQTLWVGPSQCTGTLTVSNQSQEDWTITYYNTVTNVSAGNNAIIGFVNANPNAQRSVQLTSNPACSHTLPSGFDLWNPPCTSGTFSVTYYPTYPGYPGTIGGPGCFNQGFLIFD